MISFSAQGVQAGEIAKDPMGYMGIRWGTVLSGDKTFKQATASDRTAEFETQGGRPELGDIPVDSVRFITIDQQFARVVVRYHGGELHHRVLGYLESQYGPADRTPGSMVRGLTQQFNWRGVETEVNLLYEAVKDRGILFIESRPLAPKFNEGLGEGAY